MKRWLDAAAGLGIATVALSWSLGPYLDSRHESLYHWSGSSLGFYGPVVFLFLAFWFGATLVLFLGRTHLRIYAAFWLVLLPCLPFFIERDVHAYQNTTQVSPPSPATMLSFTALCLGIVLWRRSRQIYLSRVVPAFSTVLAFVAISGALSLAQLGALAWRARHLNSAQVLHSQSPSPVSPTRHRLVCIVLDELSYDQVYEHRYPSLHLPTFDALAKAATLFTHVIPVEAYTERVLPSLFTGRRTDLVRSSADGSLWMHTNVWQRLDPQDTVFADASRLGYRNALVGWFNPYCRLLPGVLDSCTWSFQVANSNGIRPGTNIFVNAGFILLSALQGSGFENLLPPSLVRHDAEQFDPKLHIEDYELLSADADQALRNPSDTFVFLHLPIPHPGGIYNRNSGTLTTSSSSYVDNLALADHYLGHVQSLLTQSNQWDGSTVVIMGDHSWRTQLWRGISGWTAEDEAASNSGKFDDRPAYIVKLPGQNAPMQINTPFCALNTRSLLDALLRGNITTPQALASWTAQSPVSDPACAKLLATH